MILRLLWCENHSDFDYQFKIVSFYQFYQFYQYKVKLYSQSLTKFTNITLKIHYIPFIFCTVLVITKKIHNKDIKTLITLIWFKTWDFFFCSTCCKKCLGMKTQRRLKWTDGWFFLWLSVSRRLDEPGSHPPPQREAAGSRSQLPPSAWPETRRQHHPVQLAQAVEHHGETGPADHEPLTLPPPLAPTTPTPPPLGLELGWNQGRSTALPAQLVGKDRDETVSGRLLLQSDLRGPQIFVHHWLAASLWGSAALGSRSEGKCLNSEGLSLMLEHLTGTTL